MKAPTMSLPMYTSILYLCGPSCPSFFCTFGFRDCFFSMVGGRDVFKKGCKGEESTARQSPEFTSWYLVVLTQSCLQTKPLS